MTIALTEAIFETMSTADLRQELAKNLQLTKESLWRAAMCIKTLDQRHEDLSDVPPMLLSPLRKVAAGMLLPDLAFNLLDRPHLLAKVCDCSLQQQSILQKDPTTTVYELKSDGQWDCTKKPVNHLSAQEISQVFGRQGIRDEMAQKAWLQSRKEKIESPSAPPLPFRLIKAHKVVRIHSACEISLHQLREWIKLLS